MGQAATEREGADVMT